MHPFELLAEPIRRQIVEILASGEHQAGVIEETVAGEFGVGRSAAQHHLRVLRDHEWVIVRAEETERHYRLDPRVIPRLEKDVRRLRKLWNRRIGWMDGVVPRISRTSTQRGTSTASSNRGLRGHGRDPDDPWRHPEVWIDEVAQGAHNGEKRP